MATDISSQIALQVAERVRDVATNQDLIPFLSGDLRKSIFAFLVSPGEASVGSNLSYARAVHDGRKALTIKPKNKKVLAWKGPDGKMIFAKKVFQPAREGRPFLLNAISIIEGENFAFLDKLLLAHYSEEITAHIKESLEVTVPA